MALIKCVDCGKEISDTSKVCIHCGCPVEKELICNECGKKLDIKEKVCKNCGCKITKQNQINLQFLFFIYITFIIGGILLIIIIIVILPKSFNTSSTNNSTHEKIDLTEHNINEYIKVDLTGALRDYGSGYFHSVYFNGSISPSRYDLQCENVSFELEMSVSYDSTYGLTHTDNYSQTIRLDNGCNANVVDTKQLRNVAKKAKDYKYSISNAKGNIIAPKISVE